MGRVTAIDFDETINTASFLMQRTGVLISSAELALYSLMINDILYSNYIYNCLLD